MNSINKATKILGILVLMIISTGCMKYDTTMEINKDKSMNLTIITALDQNLASQMTETTNKSEIESKGFYVEEYTEDGKIGYKVTKQIKNIDDVSTEAGLSKEDMTDALNGDKEYMFTIKKGFFKDTYKAVYDFSSYGMTDMETDEEEYDPTCLYNKMDRGYSIQCGEEEIPDQESNKQAYDAMIAESNAQINKLNDMYDKMDLKFKLKLPYKAIKSNATSKSNHGKTLEWDLTKVQEVSFEFPIYHMTKIYLAIGIGVLVFLFLLATFMTKKKNKPIPKVLDETNTGDTKGFMSQMSEDDSNKESITNQFTDEQVNRFIEKEEEKEETVVEESPTINEIYNNIPMVGGAVVPEPVVEPTPEVVSQPVIPEPVVQPTPEVVAPQVIPEPVVQPVPEVVPQQVVPEQPVIDLGIPDMIPTPSDNNQ